MKQFFQTISTAAIAAITRVAAPPVARRLGRAATSLVADVPQLASAWSVRCNDPTRTGGSRPIGIDATLQQFGRIVRGTGYIQGEPGDRFVYRGVIKRNVLYGWFRRVDSHVLAGTGTFVLKISPDSVRMAGRCTWYDNLLDDVWTSRYAWTRKSGNLKP